MKKAPETPNKGGSYVREGTGKLTLKERTGSEPEASTTAVKKKGNK